MESKAIQISKKIQRKTRWWQSKRQSHWFRRIAQPACIARFLSPAQNAVAGSSNANSKFKYDT